RMALLLGDVLRRHARYRGDRTAYVIGTHRVTYARFDAMANRLAHTLAGLGVGRGDRVATLAMNRVEYPWIYFAVAKRGAIHVPLNFRWREREIAYALAQSEASVVFVSDDYRAIVEGLRSELPALRAVVPLDGDGPRTLAPLLPP